ncbi:hypothetical protein BDZ89DRAFT_421482 [Hymenopellis radicata]|nr:hypothetical protein BDZ89DRAFT_421482 [Hymenopellis radicata]
MATAQRIRGSIAETTLALSTTRWTIKSRAADPVSHCHPSFSTMLNTKQTVSNQQGLRPPSLVINSVLRTDPKRTMDCPTSPRASMHVMYYPHSRPTSPEVDDIPTGPRPIFTQSHPNDPIPEAAEMLVKIRSSSVRTSRTTASFAFMRPTRADPPLPSLSEVAGDMPISVGRPRSRFRKAMHNAGVVLRIRKKDVGIMHIAPATPRVAEKAKEDTPKNASAGGSILRGAMPRKWSKSKAIAIAESYDAFAPSNELKRAKSFSGVFANAIVEDDLDLDDATRESMGTSYILHQSINYREMEIDGSSELGYMI